MSLLRYIVITIRGLSLPTESSLVECGNPCANLLPRNLVNLVLTLLLEVLEERFVGTDGVDGICQGVDVPIVNLDTVVEDFSTA